MKKIISRHYWRSINHPHSAKDSVNVMLECGHEARFKGSQEPKHKAKCWQCDRLDQPVKEDEQ